MNNLIVLSGPSGSGKSTLINMLVSNNPEITFCTSHTTRPARNGETDGKDYYFTSGETFLKMVDSNEFVEWAQVYSNYYGTSYKEIDAKTRTGRTLVLDIDVQGAKNIKAKYPNALFVFIVPPSMKELKKRLVGREKKMTDVIKKRLKIAVDELKQYKLYDYVVINAILDDAFSVLNSIYIAYLNKSEKHDRYLENISF
ncbi:MAG: guanylate kinase [bacterium]|nr:guanylate kinase [bacterium]